MQCNDFCAAINKEKSFKNVKTASFRTENWRFWSGLRDLNPRSPGPKPGAIPNYAKPGYSVEDFAVVVKYVVKGNSTTFSGNFQERRLGEIGGKRGSAQHFGQSNRFGAPAPKPGAIPNFAKPGCSVFLAGRTLLNQYPARYQRRQLLAERPFDSLKKDQTEMMQEEGDAIQKR